MVNSIEMRIQELTERVSKGNDKLRELRRSVRDAESQVRKTSFVRKYLSVATAIRRIVDRSIVWRPGAGLITGSVLLIPPLLIFNSPIISVATGITGALLIAVILYVPPDDGIPSVHAGIIARLDKSQRILSRVPAEIAELETAMMNANVEFTELKKRQWQQSEEYQAQQRLVERQTRLQSLFARNWKALRSEPFEKYLEEVFIELDYTVQTTKVTGDQGVDLVVAKDGWKIAVQVKGYQSSVGNGAVQEAHAGMTFYDCRASACITNSLYTASATELASKLGCVLIDENNLEELVLGKFDLKELCCRTIARTRPIQQSQQQAGQLQAEKTAAMIERWYRAGTYRFDVAGVTHANLNGIQRQAVIRKFWNSESDSLELVREVRNPVDPLAMAVVTEFGQIGYVPKEYAKDWAAEADGDRTRFSTGYWNIREFTPRDGRIILMMELEVHQWRFGPKPRKGTTEPPGKIRTM